MLRLMREEAVLRQLERRFVRATDPDHTLRTYPNLLADLMPAPLNDVWLTEITSICLRRTFADLACELDA